MIGNRVGYASIFLSLALVGQAASHSTALGNEAANGVAAESGARPACELVHSIAAEIPGVSIQRSTGVFDHEALERPARGCRVAVTGTFAPTPPGRDAADRLRDGFVARGWQEMPAYSADGKDGTAFALRKNEVACLFRGDWTGGTDYEPAIVQEGAYSVFVICTSPVPPEERRR
jgi:hypothetical protein